MAALYQMAGALRVHGWTLSPEALESCYTGGTACTFLHPPWAQVTHATCLAPALKTTAPHDSLFQSLVTHPTMFSSIRTRSWSLGCTEPPISTALVGTVLLLNSSISPWTLPAVELHFLKAPEVVYRHWGTNTCLLTSSEISPLFSFVFFQNSSSSGTGSVWESQLDVSDNYKLLKKWMEVVSGISCSSFLKY